jgi:hypothetical protein
VPHCSPRLHFTQVKQACPATVLVRQSFYPRFILFQAFTVDV